jgi:hypothetical protein
VLIDRFKGESQWWETKLSLTLAERQSYADISITDFAAEIAFMSSREIVRRRRVNVLYGMVAANAVALFLGLTTGSTAMLYAFTVSFLSLAAYCYVLVQIRNQEYLRRYYGDRRAA